jgi:hypothetical protein
VKITLAALGVFGSYLINSLIDLFSRLRTSSRIFILLKISADWLSLSIIGALNISGSYSRVILSLEATFLGLSIEEVVLSLKS